MTAKKIEKLSDLIEWETDALNLLESLMVRLRSEIAQEAITVSFRNNRPKITKGTILNVLHSTRPITYFVSPED
jgi:hypothetical protein